MSFPQDPSSGFGTLLGYVLTDWRDGFARYEIGMSDRLENRQGLPHGGLHATILDAAMGLSGCWTGSADERRNALTLSLNVQYLSRPRGAHLIAEGWRTGGGRSTFFAEGKVVDETGELIAKGTGVFRYGRTG